MWGYDCFDGLDILVGKTFESVRRKDVEGNDGILFVASDGEKFALVHAQDCCESVYIEDICGELSSLENTPIVTAEEVIGESPAPPEDRDYSYTWTFFKLSTIKGSVTIRFFGSSNGYYGESAELYRISKANKPKDDAEINLPDIVDKMVEANSRLLAKLSPEARVEFIERITVDFCEYCGEDCLPNHVCYCRDDS